MGEDRSDDPFESRLDVFILLWCDECRHEDCFDECWPTANHDSENLAEYIRRAGDKARTDGWTAVGQGFHATILCPACSRRSGDRVS